MRQAAESLHRPDAAATADAAAILIERSGLRSAFSVRAKEPTKRASALSFPAPPSPLFASTSPSAHTPHAPHPAAAGSLRHSLSSSVGPPRPSVHPLRALAHPAQPDLCQRPEGKREASAAAGGVRVSWRRWRSSERVVVARRRPPRPLREPGGQQAPGHSHRPVLRPCAWPFNSGSPRVT